MEWKPIAKTVLETLREKYPQRKALFVEFERHIEQSDAKYPSLAWVLKNTYANATRSHQLLRAVYTAIFEALMDFEAPPPRLADKAVWYLKPYGAKWHSKLSSYQSVLVYVLADIPPDAEFAIVYENGKPVTYVYTAEPNPDYGALALVADYAVINGRRVKLKNSGGRTDEDA